MQKRVIVVKTGLQFFHGQIELLVAHAAVDDRRSFSATQADPEASVSQAGGVDLCAPILDIMIGSARRLPLRTSS